MFTKLFVSLVAWIYDFNPFELFWFLWFTMNPSPEFFQLPLHPICPVGVSLQSRTASDSLQGETDLLTLFSCLPNVWTKNKTKLGARWFNSVCPVKIFKENCLAFFDLWTILNPVSYFDPIELLWPSPHNSFSWSLLPSIKGGFRFPSRWNWPLRNSCLSYEECQSF